MEGHKQQQPTQTDTPCICPSRRVVVLYGSQTGCAAEVADRLCLDAYQYGFKSIICCPLDDYDIRQLQHEEMMMIVVSTQGQGEPPDNAKKFYRWILRKDLPSQHLLSHLHFSVFGLGDSSYPIYNAIGRRIYQRMIELGAQLLHRRGLGDDQDECGYETGLNEWRPALWREISNKVTWIQQQQHTGSRVMPPKYVVSYHPAEQKEEMQSIQSETSWCQCVAQLPLPSHDDRPVVLPPVRLPPFGMGSNTYSPFPALLVSHYRLTPSSHFQDVRHLELDLTAYQRLINENNNEQREEERDNDRDTSTRFEPGDVLDIFPRNHPSLIRDFILSMEWQPTDVIHIQRRTDTDNIDDNQSATLPLPARCILQDLFEVHLDVLGTPRRSFFEFLAPFALDEMQRDKLLELSSPEGQRELWKYNQKEKRTYAEVLADFSSARPPLDALISAIPRLQPRAFSISSSSLLHPGRAHITAALVRFTTPWKRERTGVCSTFFSLLPQNDPTSDSLSSRVFLPVRVRRGSFRVPSVVGAGGPPVIMCGPGTGMAPFRAMCQHKRALLNLSSSSSSLSVTQWSPYVFVFGNRNRRADYFYEDEWTEFSSTGVLSHPVITAFSRDQPEKYYVQDAMLEPNHCALLYELLVKQRGYFIVAGSAGDMPKDVRKTLVQILMSDGSMDEQHAQDYLRTMEKERRYIQEVW